MKIPRTHRDFQILCQRSQMRHDDHLTHTEMLTALCQAGKDCTPALEISIRNFTKAKDFLIWCSDRWPEEMSKAYHSLQLTKEDYFAWNIQGIE